MKHMIKLPVVILGLMLLFGCTTQKAMAQDDDISLDVFYDELAPYGDWTQDPEYGDVWRPNVDMSNFRPYYTDGHWAMTEYGNTWVSDYDWGWAPFHYGRWVLNRFNDWIWVPDTVWGPAWVSWREGNGYYGWAPLSPGLDVNVGIGGYDIPGNWWVFIPQINIYNTSYPRYYYRNNNYFNRTRYINYTYGRGRHNYYTGPRATDIRRVTRRDVTVYNISRSNRPGRTSITNNNINIYNPGRGRRDNSSSFGQTGRNNTSGRTGGMTNGRSGQPDRNTPGRDSNQGQRTATEGRRGRDQGQRVNGADRQNDQQQAQQRQEQMQRQQRDGQRRSQERDAQNNQQQAQQRQEQMQRQQRDAQNNQQQAQQRQEQVQRQQRDAQNQQRQQQDQQRQEMQRQQRQQQDQQRQQQAQQQRQQQDQQRQEMQRQQRDAQNQQRQQQDQQRQQQAQQQRQQQDQQRQQQAQQQRQQQDQQRQQQRSQEQSRPTRTEGGRSGRGN